jgi:hypothetical protein
MNVLWSLRCVFKGKIRSHVNPVFILGLCTGTGNLYGTFLKKYLSMNKFAYRYDLSVLVIYKYE